MSLGVLQFMGAHKAKDGLPRRMSVTPGDRYVLDLLIRHFQKVSKRRTRVLNWTKAGAPALAAEMEEVSLFGGKPFHVVLGAPSGWVKGLEPAPDTFILSEEPDGTLKGEDFTWRTRAMGLRALSDLLDLPWGVLDMKRVDWSWCRSWADFEPLLARGKLLQWDLNRLMREATSRTRASLLGLIADGRWWDIHFLGERYGRPWLYRSLQETVVDVVRFHDYRASGYTLEQVQRLLVQPDWIFEQTRDAGEDFSESTLLQLAQRIVHLDAHVSRDLDRGLDRLMMGAKLT